MLEPFVRGDEARNMDEAAGFGLGLSSRMPSQPRIVARCRCTTGSRMD
jgi:hypothetical protein